MASMEQPRTTVLLRLGNEPEATRRFRAALARVVESYDLPDEDGFDLKLAATEAVTNAIKGAPEDHAVEVMITGSPDGVDVEVTDGGAFVPEHHGGQSLDAESGRGIPLIRALVDEVEFASVGHGTRVLMRKRASRARNSLSG
jgi:serine/threonine-protein kinase RsbW